MRQLSLFARALLALFLAFGPVSAATPLDRDTLAATESEAPPPRMIYFRNDCAEPIETAIHYQAVDGTWRMSRWMSLAPAEQRAVGRTGADVYFSTARKDGATMPAQGRKARAVVYGDDAPSLFGVRPLEGLGAGDVLQVFGCGEG